MVMVEEDRSFLDICVGYIFGAYIPGRSRVQRKAIGEYRSRMVCTNL